MSGGEVEAIVVTRYRCAYCRRSWSKRPRTAEHAAKCWLNPDARSCGTCTNYHPGYDGGWDEPGAPSLCSEGLPVWITPDGYTDLRVHPRGCPSWSPAPLPPSEEE